MAPSATPTSARRGHAVLGAIAWVLALCACVACLLQAFVPASLDGRFPIPQIVAFGPWFGLVAVVAAGIALYAHRRLVAVLTLICALYQGWWCLGYWIPSSEAGLQGTPAARVMTLNCYFGGASAQEIVALVDQGNIQLLCLQEVTDALYGDLVAAGLEERLPYWCGAITGNQLWSSVPLVDPVDDAVGYSGSAMPAATVDLGWGPVRFVSVHTCAPVPGLENYWDESLYKLAHIRSYDIAAGVPYILMGDFNATTEHASFREILASGLADGAYAAGEGMVFTWPVNTGLPALVTLDHILLGENLVARDFDYVVVSGSDHKGMLATVGGVA